MEKVVILGSGIAGLTSAIYAARATLSPLVISGMQRGGQLTMTTDVENFPGFPDGIQGPELTERAFAQAKKFGARFKDAQAVGFELDGENYKIVLNNGEVVLTESLIIATGASARWLGIPSEEKFKGRGVGTCATCDGFFYKDKEVLVVGGGDSAMEEAIFLTKFASKVTVIHRRSEFRASKIMQERFFKNPKTDVIWDSEIKEIKGDFKGVSGVVLLNKKTGEVVDFSCEGIFLALGHIPNTKIFQEKLDVDEKGYLIADKYTRTKLKGVFVAGDVQDSRFRQAISAAGSGCMAAMEAEKYLYTKE